jgi:hypothetical protein
MTYRWESSLVCAAVALGSSQNSRAFIFRRFVEVAVVDAPVEDI